MPFTASDYLQKDLPVEMVRYGLHHYSDVEVYRLAMTGTNLTDLCDALYNEVHGDYAGDYAPTCHRVVVNKNKPVKGIATCYALYRTLRVPGKAVVRVDISSEARHAIYDTAGKLISGYDANAGDWVEPVRGSDLQLEPKAVVKIETAYAKTAVNLGTIMSLIGRINAAALANLGLGAKTCLMLSSPLTKIWDQDALWYANYAMAYNPDGWEKTLAVMHYEQINLGGRAAKVLMGSGATGTVTVTGAGNSRTLTATTADTFASWMIGLPVAITGAGAALFVCPITAYTSGTVVTIDVSEGDPVNAGGYAFQVPILRTILETGDFSVLDGYVSW